MNDNSPNGLTVKPNVTSMSKWPIVAIFAGCTVLFLVFYYSLSVTSNTTTENPVSKKVDITESEDQLTWLADGSGLALNPKKDQMSGVLPPPSSKVETKKTEPIIVIRGQGRDEDAEHVRRTRTQAFVSALNSPLLAKRVSEAKIQQVASSTQGREFEIPAVNMPANMGNQLDPYDPAADRDKEAFFARSQKGDGEWILNNVRTAGQLYEMKTGTIVPSVMVTGINSDLPGTLIAQVSQNVFDTATGRHLLIPQGSKLFGIYDSRIIFGQSRVLVAWNRIIYPDGSALTLPAMPGVDMAGNAGFEDKTNNHYMRMFGSATMMALITGAMTYAVDGVSAASGDTDDNSLQSQMTGALAQQIGQTTTKLLEKNLNIKPSLEIRPGYQFNVVLTKDITFEKPYTAWRGR